MIEFSNEQVAVLTKISDQVFQQRMCSEVQLRYGKLPLDIPSTVESQILIAERTGFASYDQLERYLHLFFLTRSFVPGSKPDLEMPIVGVLFDSSLPSNARLDMAERMLDEEAVPADQSAPFIL